MRTRQLQTSIKCIGIAAVVLGTAGAFQLSNPRFSHRSYVRVLSAPPRGSIVRTDLPRNALLAVSYDSRSLDAKSSDSHQVEWLLRSTELVLGNRDQWLNKIDSSCVSQLPSQFSSHREYIIQAESIMKSWLKWMTKKQNTTSVKNRLTMTSAGAAQIVEQLLNQTLHIYNEWEELKLQNEVSYLTTTRADLLRIAIDAWAKCKSKSSVDSVIQLLHRSQNNVNGQMVTYANEECYHAVIKACISNKQPKDLDRAIGLLQEMQSTFTICPSSNIGYDDDESFSCIQTQLYPTTQIYNLVLYGLANCEPCVKNAELAESLLELMLSNHKSVVGHDCVPESNTFRQVVSAWTKSGSKNAEENAHRILNMMLAHSVTPDASTYNAIMTLYLQRGKPGKALQLFDQLISSGRTNPDSYSVNLMLRARTFNPHKLTMDSMEEIEGLLLRMEPRYGVCATTQSFNIIIDAFARSDLPDAANRSQALLDLMERKCRSGDKSSVPDSYTFTSVLSAISRATSHSFRGAWAESILRRMKQMSEEGLVEAPTTPVYNAVLNSLITSNERGAFTRAKSLFTQMEAMANTRSYNIMIKSHSLMGSNADGIIVSYARPSKAKALLYQMEQSNGLAPPDVFSYTTVIVSYSRSNVRRKAMKAFGILKRAIAAGITPSIYAFNGGLNACATTGPADERIQAFTILVSCLIMIREWTKPDDATYKVLVKACERLLPAEEARRKQVIDLVFRELEFQSDDPEFHSSMMNKFLNMEGG